MSLPVAVQSNVAPGTYIGNVNVNKSVTLKGAQAGVAVSGRTAGASESTISGRGYHSVQTTSQSMVSH